MAKSEHIPDDLWSLPRKAAESLRLGLPYYFTGEPCPNGHVDVRTTAKRECRHCMNERTAVYAKKINGERTEAKQLKRFLDGGLAAASLYLRIDEVGMESALAEADAMEAAAAKAKRLHDNEKARQDYQKRLIREGAEKVHAKDRVDDRTAYAKNPEPRRLRTRKRHSAGKSGYRYNNTKTPTWLTPEEHAEMQALYDRRDKQKREEVDHIVPRDDHPLIAGLHVPWNLQILSRAQNAQRKKGQSNEFKCDADDAADYVAKGMAVWREDIDETGKIKAWAKYPRPSDAMILMMRERLGLVRDHP